MHHRILNGHGKWKFERLDGIMAKIDDLLFGKKLIADEVIVVLPEQPTLFEFDFVALIQKRSLFGLQPLLHLFFSPPHKIIVPRHAFRRKHLF